MAESSETMPFRAHSTSHCHHYQYHAPSCPLSRPSASCSYHQKQSCHHLFRPPVNPLFLRSTDPRFHTSQCPFPRMHRGPFPIFRSPIPRSLQPTCFLRTMEEPKVVVSDCRETDSWAIPPEEQTNEFDEEEEEEEEPAYVLTDEWMEFFAKSEAKRKSERQQKQKKGNK